MQQENETECLERNEASTNTECFAVTEQLSSGDLYKDMKESTFHSREVVQGSCDKLLRSRLMPRVNRQLKSFCMPLSGLCSLTTLNLSNCNLGERSFPNYLSCLPSLVALNLSGNNFFSLPASIRSLPKLQYINLENCKGLGELSGLPPNSKLDVRAEGCSSLEVFDAANLSNPVKSYFNFINCFRLNDSQGSNNTAFAMLKAFLLQVISNQTERETFQIVIPGSRIPKWFTHRWDGDSIIAQLPEGWNDGRFLGFSLCAVFKLHQHHRANELHIDEFKTFNATHHLICCLKLDGRELAVSGAQPAFRFSQEFCQVESDHLWLFYVSREKYFGTEWQNNVCSSIKFTFKTRGPGLKVKKCGVRLIYKQHLKELNQTSNRKRKPAEDLVGIEKPVEGRQWDWLQD